LSATPERGDGISLARLFPDVALDFPMFGSGKRRSAIHEGWSVPFDQRFVSVEGVDFQNLGDVSHDYTDNELDEVLRHRETLLSMVTPLIDLVEDRRTIIFSPTKKMARAVAHTINEFIPHSARSVDGEADRDLRKKRFGGHQAGKYQFLSVCGLCREGYNDPGIGAVGVFRPTKSRSLKEQMIGRGSRPLKGIVDGLDSAEERRAAIAASDKPNCMIVDLVGITGLPPVASTAHLLASGKPDEVINLANRNALKNKGPTDMADEIAKAEKQISDENEASRLRQIEQQRLEREEAERLAKIKGDVRYSASQVENGHGVAKREIKGTKTELTKIPFGKFKDKKFRDLPGWYLDWCVNKCGNGGVKRAAKKRN
jgi:superfamily II DNA or RNA helicase